ncbi:MAG: hypothetical protein IPP71_16620 [Bacteroidetes bacterium]|nr:hypothetical protein [Bacteroidota bacterium]
MKYEINPVQFPTIYTISPIKPLRIKDENIKKLYRGFVKGGYGTKNTPYAEIFYNSLRSKSFDAGVHLNYLSSSGKIKGYGFPGMSESGIQVFGTKFFDNSLLKGELGYNRSVYHYYGYDSPPDILSKSETKHSFDDAFGKFSLQSNHKDVDRFSYSGGLDFYLFNDNNSNDETNFAFHGSFGKMINDVAIKADIDLDFLKYDTQTFKPDDRNIIRVNPRVEKTIDKLTLSAGANIAIEINDLTTYHFYPHARIDYILVDDVMRIFGQLTGSLQRNSYKTFSNENPFLGKDFKLRNTNNKLDVTAGLNVKLDKQLAFIGSIGLKRLNDDAFFRNVPTTSSLVVYDVIYDNNTQTNIHAEIVYDQGEKTVWSLTADYNGNKTSREDRALFRPDFRFALNGNYIMADKIHISTQWAYVTTRYAVDYAPGSNYRSLKGFIDGNLTIDYRYSKVMSVFLKVNNITASNYSRWYNYPSYRFGAMAGLSYSF